MRKNNDFLQKKQIFSLEKGLFQYFFVEMNDLHVLEHKKEALLLKPLIYGIAHKTTVIINAYACWKGWKHDVPNGSGSDIRATKEAANDNGRHTAGSR